MFTSMTKTNPASEYRKPPSKSFVLNDTSLHDAGYFVSEILDGEEVILLNSNSEGIQKTTSALQKYASIFREIDKVRTIYGGSSGKRQLGSVILSSDDLKPDKSQLPQCQSSLSEKRGLGSCYADRDSDTLGNGDGRDRLFAN